MKRNKHNLSHYKLFSADMGFLYPISCFEVLPGDTVQMSSSVFLRFAPMLAAVMHPIKVGIYSFYVPLRLLWDDFEDFITGGPDGMDTTTPPTFSSSTGIIEGSLADYLGVPTGYTGKFSSLPSRAYYRIYNEYFRDQDLVDPIITGEATSSGNTALTGDSITAGGQGICHVAWEKDYFTTARPWPQKGPTVTIPVNGASNPTFSIVPDSTSATTWEYVDNDGANPSGNGPLRRIVNELSGGGLSASTLRIGNSAAGTEDINLASVTTQNTAGNVFLRMKDPHLKAVQSGGGFNNANIRLDDLREAFALQRFEEHRALYGSRYTEYLRYLGVRSSDARLQRPEYLGGGKTTMQISEVLQTAADGDNPVGTLRGHGIGAVASKTFRRFIEENGLIMTLMKVQPVAIYQQGLNKMFSRATKEDYWQKELEHIGQQEVMSRELYGAADADTVFGYQNRYDEYRAVPSTVSGEMRSTLDYWHMSRIFANEPVLNSSFIIGQPTKRIFAEQTMNEIYCLAQHKVVARRFLSKQGNPIM